MHRLLYPYRWAETRSGMATIDGIGRVPPPSPLDPPPIRGMCMGMPSVWVLTQGTGESFPAFDHELQKRAQAFLCPFSG